MLRTVSLFLLLCSFSGFAIETLTMAGKPEDEVIAAITADGLTLKRYNRLVDLTQSYPSIRTKVTEMVIEQRRLDS